MAAAINANLLAAVAPPVQSPSASAPTTASATQPASRSGFADVLSQAAASREPTSVQPDSTASATAETTNDLTDPTAGQDLAAALATIGLIQQPLQTDPTSVVTAAITLTATEGVPTPALSTIVQPQPTGDASRSEQLRFDSAPAARGTPITPAVPTPTELPSAPGTAEIPTTSAAIPGQTGAIPTSSTPNTTVATTPTDVVRAANRTPAVVPQAPVIAERSQQLPALPPELGYGLIGPTVTAPPEVNPVASAGTTASQSQVEILAATLPRLEPTITTTPNNAKPFAAVLADQPVTTPAPASRATPAAPTVNAVSMPTASLPPVDMSAPVTVSESAAGATPIENGNVPTLPSTDTPTQTTRPTVAGEQVYAKPSVELPAMVLGTPASVWMPTSIGEPVSPEATVNDIAVSVNPSAVAATPSSNLTTAPTPTASPQAPTAPPVAAQLQEAFTVHARVIETGGGHEFQIRLDPPELGEVKVRVLALGDRVEARLVVSDDAVRKLIESQLPELRQRLEQAGVTVPRFDVSTDTGGGRANTGGGGWERPQPFTPSPRQSAPAPAPAPRLATRPVTIGGTLDVTA
ncbi:MAG: flagellar hook-length control protein FliK [Fimbriiglobus sp.]|jgi:flagellar hook-length control protein FliK|nr:flagellar hook-length control protein FliK [Fimbriiglobus sp.]